MKEITTRIYEIRAWAYEDNTDYQHRNIVGLLFINSGYDKSLVEQYLDGDEMAIYRGEFKQVGLLNVLNNIPPIYRIEIDG